MEFDLDEKLVQENFPEKNGMQKHTGYLYLAASAHNLFSVDYPLKKKFQFGCAHTKCM